jgi:hypothetical protein
MTNFHLVWSYEYTAAAIAAWQDWAPLGPDELSADLVLTATNDPASAPVVEIFGAVIGQERQAYELLGELTTRVGAEPDSDIRGELPYEETCLYQAERSVAYDQVEHTPQGLRLRPAAPSLGSPPFRSRPPPRRSVTPSRPR